MLIINDDITNLFDNFSSEKEDKYYIGSGENPSAQMVTIEMDGSNYITWRKYFKMVVNSKKKLGFLTCTIFEPREDDDDTYEKWSMCNDMVYSWILNNITTYS